MRTKLNLAIILTVLMVSGALAWRTNEVGATFANPFLSDANSSVTTAPALFGAPEYNAREEFSLTQGGTSGVWRYGSTANDASNVFVENLTTRTTPECGSPAERWNLSNTGDPSPEIIRFLHATNCIGTPADSLYVHPGPSGQRSVLRWIAPAAGTYQLTGALQRANSIATTDIRIVKNETTSLFSGSIGTVYQQAFNVTVTVAMNEPVDFSIGWGDNDNSNSDGSALNVTVAPAPTACMSAPANLQISVPGENSPTDVQSVNTNAQLVGNATYTNSGKVGRAMSFDGSGDYVRIEDNAAQRPATAVTVEGWFKLNSTSGIVQLVGKPVRGTFTNSYGVYLDGGTLRGLVGNNLGQWTRANSGYSPTLGQWNHLAFTYVMNSGVSTLKLYANGVDITSSVDGTANLPLYYDANPYPLIIGADIESDAPAFSMNGQADEVSIYGRALSGAEIFDIVQQGSFGKCPPANCVQPASGLVSWYAGEQNALDSRSNNHGTLQNGASFTNGKVGQAINFDGTDDFVAAPDNASLDIVGELSIEAWIRPTANPAFSHIVSKRSLDNANAEYDLLRQANGAIRFSSKNAFTDSFVVSNGTAPINAWTHVAVTIEGGTLKFYINGIEDSSHAFAFVRPATAGRLTIGAGEATACGGSGVCEYFAGQIDELSIYNRAISASEALSVFNANSSGKCKPTGSNPPTNQSAWFTGDGDARDLTGPSTGGTLSGDTTYRVGKVAQAFKLDGSGDYISTPDNAKWDFGAGDFAIESWFNTPSGTGVQRIISAGAMSDGGNNLWSLGYGDICAWGCGQRINFAVHNGSGSYSDFSSNQLQIRPNTWHHVAVVRSGTTFTFYFDGVASGTATVGAGYAINGGSTGAIIGARYNSNPNDRFEFANGMLDEISLYSRAVTSNEIAAIYNAGVAGKTKFEITFPQANDTTQISDATVTFANNISGGWVSQHGIDLGTMPPLPANTTSTGLAYEISTTATYQTGNPDDVRVCFNIPALSTIGAGGLRLLHLENGNWVDRTASGNSLSNFCSDNLRTLSPFVIVEGNAPSSYGISGRVTNGGGNGVANVLVTLSGDANSTATTNTNGDYSFGSLNAGGSFTITPSLAGYNFVPTNRVYNPLTESITNAHFTAAAIPTVSMGDVTVTEGDSGSVNANFNVTLSSAYPSDVTVLYSTYDGTATGGLDYTSVGTSVVFAPGETSKVVSVPVLGDTIDEENETFNIYIGQAINATILDASGVGTINDNDVAQCVAVPTGRVASYKGENSATDSQGANHGTANGGVTYVSAKVGQGFKFDGANDHVEVPDNASLKPANLTIETWVKFDSMTSTTTGGAPTGYQNLIFKKNSRTPGTGFEGGYSLVKNPDDRIGVGFNSPSTATDFASSTTVMQTGVWYHIAATHDGTNIKLYINGQLEGTGTATFSIDYGTTPLYLGSSQVPFSGYFSGILDESSIYDRALTDSEVLSIFNAGTAGTCPTGQCVTLPSDQSAWYRGEGNANDSQGTGNGAGFNGVTYSVGKVGQAFEFPDGNAHVQVPDSAAVRPTSFTVEGWFNFASYNNEYRQLIGKSTADPSYSSYGLYIYGGLLSATSTNGVDLGNSLSYSLAPIPGQWYHIAFTRQDGGDQKLFVNGLEVDSDTANAIAYTNTPLVIGHDTGGSIHGKVDEVSIFGRAMTAGEIQSIYAAGGAGKCPNGTCIDAPSEMQSWYRFQGNAEDVLNLRPGAAQGNPSYVAGRVGQAIDLDGVDDSVDFGSWFNYNTFSISMWINVAPFSEQPAWANILDNNHTGGTNWVIQRPSTENRYIFGDGGGGEVSFTPTPNVWQHLTVTRENSTSLKVYLDGVLVGEDNSITSINYSGSQFVRLGRWGGGGRHLKGKIDELDIYTRVLSPSEVGSIYGAGTAGKCVPAECAETPANQISTFKAENNANDSQGTNSGTANGGVTYIAGKVGQAFNFPDGGANVSVPDSPSLRPDSFTVEGWYNFTTYANEYRTLFNKSSADPSYSSYGMYIYGGVITASSSDGVNLGNSLSHGLYPTPGQWYHIAFAREAGGQMKLFVNGVQVDSQASNASIGYSNTPLTINNGGGASESGKIDELSIYSRALSANEIQSIFDAGSAGKCPELGCGTADYQFNDNLESSIPGAIPLSFIGTGQTFTTETVNGASERVMNYVAGNAVELRPTTSVIPSNQYEITILTKFNQTYSYNRILDFKDGSDVGIYVTSGMLTFYGASVQGPPTIGAGVWVELKFTRTAAGIFTAYVNGVQQFSFNDTAGHSIIGPTNALRFFKDDANEHYGGAIARVHLSPGDGCSGGGQCVAAPADNVAWYRGNNNPLDLGSNPPMHASMENGATFALGKVGNGFSFDGVNDFVSAPDDNKFDITGDLSIESWVRPAQIQSGEVALVSKRDAANSNVNYVLYLQNGQLKFASRNNGGGFTVNSSGIALSPATFSHVAVTIESGSLRFYVNGVATAPQATAATRSASTGRLTIGAYETTSAGDFFNGVIDELAIYSRALTAGEILSIFNADSAGKCASGGNTTTYSIGGRVTDHNGAGLGSVAVALSDGATNFGSIQTDANGYYLWYNLQANSNYIVTPTLVNTTFTPASRSYTNITNNVADANFAANAPCTYTLDPPTGSIFPAAGGTGTFNVQTQPGCSWTATTTSNSSSWVTFNGPTTGTGNGTVNYTVAANTGYIRVGDIFVNGIQHLIGQETGSGTCASVMPITYGTVFNGALTGGDCNLGGRNTDQYSFSGTAGDRVMIRLSSSDFAEALIVHNSANTTIFTTATGGAATDARIPNSYGFFTLPVTGTYIVSATNWGNGGSPTGNYTFTLHSDRTVPGVTPPAGLIGWYAGEADTRNQQGNSPGTFNGTATYATDYVGQSFNMNGTDRYVEIPSASEPFNVSSISVEAWVNTTTTAGNRTIASKFNGAGGASWSLDMEAGGSMIFTVHDGTTANFRATRAVGSAALLTANEWKHVVATFDHTTQAIGLYVNGAYAGDLVAGSSPNIGGIGQNSVPLRIGAKFDGSMQGFWSGRLDEVSIYNRAITHEEVESIIDAGRIGKIKSAALSNQTTATLGTSTINFAVATTGTATETPIDVGALPAPLPVGQGLHLAFNISTNAPFTGNATVCFAVPTVTPAEFGDLKVYHLEGSIWVDRTAPGNVYPTLCALTPSFSPFAIAKPLAPSSSSVSVAGRVLTADGRGVNNTQLSLSLADGSVLRTRSSSFGYYHFDNVESGQTGVLSIHSKRFTFAQPNRVITISNDLNDLDFIAEP